MFQRSTAARRACARRGIARGRFLFLVATLAVLAGPLAARAQDQPAPAQDQPGTAKVATSGVSDIAMRYRLLERYAPPAAANQPAPGIVGYTVAFRDKIVSNMDNPQGAPRSRERRVEAVYQERPAEVSAVDPRKVGRVVRRYGRVQIAPGLETRAPGPPPFEGLEIWYEQRPGNLPHILALTPGRSLTDLEYSFAASQLYVPDLAFVLPDTPVRVGETYGLSSFGVTALLGPSAQRARLVGRLEEVRPDPKNPDANLAILDITGQAVTNRGATSIHAQVHFSFTPAQAPAPTSGATAKAAPAHLVDAQGQITRLIMAEESTGAAGDRLRTHARRELILDRQFGGDAAALPIPEPPPTPTPENSWITYDDPQGRFRFRHPQELMVMPAAPGPAGEADQVQLLRARATGGDRIVLSLKPKAELEPESVRDGLEQDWGARGMRATVSQDATGWLPEAEWPPDRKVFRIEAALEAPIRNTDRTMRIYYDGYVVQTGRERGLLVEGTTTQDPPLEFRGQIEELIRSFELDPTGGPAPAAPAEGPAPAPAP